MSRHPEAQRGRHRRFPNRYSMSISEYITGTTSHILGIIGPSDSNLMGVLFRKDNDKHQRRGYLRQRNSENGSSACYYAALSQQQVWRHEDLLKAVSLSGHVLQILLQSLAELAELLLGNHHLLTNQQQRLQRKREREECLLKTF